MPIDPRRIPAYYQGSFIDHGDGCAQSAMASVLVYLGKARPEPDLAEKLYRDPRTGTNLNFLFVHLGTNWERVQEVLKGYGLHTNANNVPILEAVPEHEIDQRIAWIAAMTAKGIPVCVVLGNGEIDEALGGGWGLFKGAHWGIVLDVDASGTVTCANFPDAGGVIRLPRAGFRNAWKARLLPGVHYAAVAAWPSTA